MAQSQLRKLKRVSLGQQNDAPNSTKVSPHTEASKQISKGPGYRANRFKK